MKTIFKRICMPIFLMSLFFLSFVAQAKTPAEELENKLNQINSMQADFVEKISKAKMHSNKEQRGHMALSRPGKFRWDVLKPQQQLIIADGKYLWIYDADLAQVTKEKLDYRTLGVPQLLLSGSITSLESIFTISKNDNAWFELKPKSHDDAYQWIKLYFDKNGLKSMQILDQLGQLNTIDFQNIKINSHPSPSLFRFTPKDDVDVVNR